TPPTFCCSVYNSQFKYYLAILFCTIPFYHNNEWDSYICAVKTHESSFSIYRFLLKHLPYFMCIIMFINYSAPLNCVTVFTICSFKYIIVFCKGF
uniref:Uncharacterized protein n=1 Tax=Ciona intestinalis TaxID=7719 RepID=H2XX70_CIOIN